jgi:GDSL-like lipase/acylhydrolase family protein
MNKKLRLVLSMFALGILVGVGTSPWFNLRPSNAFISPVDLSLAFESSNQERDVQKRKDKGVTMAEYFEKFNKELNKEEIVEEVLGEETSNEELVSTRSGSLTIAIIGDSMVDTMGTGLPYLAKILNPKYPNMVFNFLNYGIGSENIKMASERIGDNYIYKDRSYPKINELSADVIIVESFAYNPIGDVEDNKTEYIGKLIELFNTAKSQGARVVFLASIAPLKVEFGLGPGGIGWQENDRWQHATKIQGFMELGIATAKNMEIPIIDAYHPTLLKNGEGTKAYVSSHDGIHPSEKGHEYMAWLISEYLKNNELL